jgi:hypothetical protein
MTGAILIRNEAVGFPMGLLQSMLLSVVQSRNERIGWDSDKQYERALP